MPEDKNIEYTSENLIKFIEHQALIDIKDIDVSSDEENSIDLGHVHTWYIETEKLIRILANIIPSTMAQPINQLSYAGHHILKAMPSKSEDKGNPNLIEAYKHCKRAYFDSLDLYVFHMSDVFRSKASLLVLSDKDFEQQIIQHLDNFTNLRFNHEKRIDYYSGVSKTLKNGLSLIAEINGRLQKQGITNDLLRDKSIIIQEHNKIKENNKILEKANNKLILEAENKFNRNFVILSVIVLLVTAGSILFQGFFTEKLITSKTEGLLTIKNMSLTRPPLHKIKNTNPATPALTESNKSKSYTYKKVPSK